MSMNLRDTSGVVRPTVQDTSFRELTDQELDYITDDIRNTYADIDLYDYSIRNIRRNIREQLSGQMMDVSNIDTLKSIVQEQWITSKVPNGVYKGIQTSHVLGQFATQTTLHSKRGQQGAKSYVSAFDTIKEYVKFKADLKENLIYTFLKNRIEYEKAFRRFIPMFTQVNLSEILLNYSLYDLDVVEEYPDMSWYERYFQMGGNRPDRERVFIRMHLDKDMIYSMKITVDVLISNLSRSFKDLAILVPAPSYMGIIDIYPVTERLKGAKSFKQQVLNKIPPSAPIEDVIPKLFISGSIIPNLDNLQVSGISGVEYVHPVRMSISSVLNGEKRIGEDQWGSSMWEIIWDQITATNTGITSEDVKDLFRTVGIDPIQYSHIPDRLFIIGWTYRYSPLSVLKAVRLVQGFTNYTELDDGWVISYDSSIITDRSDIDIVLQGLYQVEAEHLTDSAGIQDDRIKITGWNYQNDPQEELSRLASEYRDQDDLVYLEIHSLNYVDIMSHDKVDARRTLTNNPRNILNTLGIEALRNVMIVNIGRLLEQSGSEFNFRHIELLVDHFTMHGYVTPVSTIGIEGQRLGPFTESSFQEGDKILLKAAQFGRTDNINTPSAYLTVGKRGAFGRDYNESLGTPISRDPEENRIYMRWRRENSTSDYVSNAPLELSEYDIKMDEMAMNVENPGQFIILFQDVMKSSPVPPVETLGDIVNTIALRNTINTPSLDIRDRRLFTDQLRFLSRNHSAEFVVYLGNSIRHLGLLSSLFPHITFLVFTGSRLESQVYTEESYGVTVERTQFTRDIPEDYNIVVYNESMTEVISADLGDYLDGASILLISDLISDRDTDTELIRGLALQYRWTYELTPDQALLQIRLPEWDQNELDQRSELDILLSLEDGLAIDLLNDYREKRFRYLSGEVMIQPWSDKFSDMTSLYTTGQSTSIYPEDYRDKLSYYNLLERPYRYHLNDSADREIGFDHCNDCSAENKIWRDYLDARERMMTEDLLPSDSTVPSVRSLVDLLSGGPTRNTPLLSGGHGRFYSNPIDPALIII